MTDRPLTYAESASTTARSIRPRSWPRRAAAGTARNLARWGMSEVLRSRGESAYVWEEPDAYRAIVVEGLGTKSLVADATRPITRPEPLRRPGPGHGGHDRQRRHRRRRRSRRWSRPTGRSGDSAWFEDRERAADLVRGWAAACDASGATWGGGETPVLSGIIAPGTIDLAGACVGVVRPKDRLVLGDRLAPGDAIVLLAASGIHANGLTLARRIADELPEGYATRIGDGTTYGEALLAPTHLYARLWPTSSRPVSRCTTWSTSPATAGASSCAPGGSSRYRMHTVPRAPALRLPGGPRPTSMPRTPTAPSTWAPASRSTYPKRTSTR